MLIKTLNESFFPFFDETLPYIAPILGGKKITKNGRMEMQPTKLV